MLSEKRKKVKYSTDPNGNLWANSANNFGRQMLQRMGWSPGEGLGKDGTGIRAPIKASTQKSTRGLGMKSDYTLGSKQMDEYADLLRTLNASCSSSSSIKRLNSAGDVKNNSTDKSRPHLYSKIIKAKDTAQYDQQALSVILGRTSKINHSSELSLLNVKKEDTTSLTSLKTVNSPINMHDYFEQCRKKKKFSSDSGQSENFVNRLNNSTNIKAEIGIDSCDNSADSNADIESNPIEKREFSNDSIFYGTNLLNVPGYACY